MPTASDSSPSAALNAVTQKQLDLLKTEMATFAITQHKKASKLREILESVRPMIEASRSQGTSWTVIAGFINGRLGTRIHAATIRSYIAPKRSKMSAADELSGAVDLSLSATDHASQPGPEPQ
jgi:hypothetical protein